MERRLYSVSDAATYLGGISRSMVYREVRAGRLAFVQIGTRTMFDLRDLDAYIDASRRGGPSTSQPDEVPPVEE